MFRILLLLTCLLLSLSQHALADSFTEREDWGKVFAEHDAIGTIVVIDKRNKAEETYVYNPERAGTQFCPASTFKIPHCLFALEAGVVKSEFDVFKWDGEARMFDIWNRDHDLRSSMSNSVVWVYEHFAREIGEEREAEYLRRANYGNMDISGGLESFWLDDSLQISAHEQLDFLQSLYRNDLDFAPEHQRLVKDMIIMEAQRDWILRGKTGWSGSIGWLVGWVEWPDGPVFFALNIDTPNRLEDLPKREAIVRALLRSLKALPSDEAPAAP